MSAGPLLCVAQGLQLADRGIRNTLWTLHVESPDARAAVYSPVRPISALRMHMHIDVEEIREQLLAPNYGYFVLRDFYDPSEIRAYYEECDAMLESSPRYHTRINSDRMPDYIHPRSHDDTARTYRIYQFLHNRHSDSTSAFFDKFLRLRYQIENEWTNDPTYVREQQQLQNYVIVTKYLPGTGMLPRHRDYSGPAQYPLLQSLVLLTDPVEDFRGGEFTLFTKAGGAVRVLDDCDLAAGDLFVFDKSLDHEVATTTPGKGFNRGRWSVLIGARAVRDSRLAALSKKVLFSPTLYPIMHRLRSAI